MAQIIKHRRGSISALKDVTANVGELVMGTGSIGNLNAPVLFIGDTAVAGGYKPVSKIYQGTGLGLAISNDGGNNWNKFSEGPIFGTSYKEPGYTGTISIIKKDKLFYGYYLSCRDWKIFDSKPEPIYDIKYALIIN